MLVLVGDKIINLAQCRHIKLHVKMQTLTGMTVYFPHGEKMELDDKEAAYVYQALLAVNGAKQADSRIVPASGLISSH